MKQSALERNKQIEPARQKQLQRHRLIFRTVLVLVLFTVIGLVASVSYHLSGGNPQTLPIEQTLRSLFHRT